MYQALPPRIEARAWVRAWNPSQAIAAMGWGRGAACETNFSDQARLCTGRGGIGGGLHRWAAPGLIRDIWLRARDHVPIDGPAAPRHDRLECRRPSGFTWAPVCTSRKSCTWG